MALTDMNTPTIAKIYCNSWLALLSSHQIHLSIFWTEHRVVHRHQQTPLCWRVDGDYCSPPGPALLVQSNAHLLVLMLSQSIRRSSSTQQQVHESTI